MEYLVTVTDDVVIYTELDELVLDLYPEQQLVSLEDVVAVGAMH